MTLLSTTSGDELIVSECTSSMVVTDDSAKDLRAYCITQDNRITRVVLGRQPRQRNEKSFWHQWFQQGFMELPLRVSKDLLLPVGFPDSVEKTYLAYQVYDSLQGLCSYLRGVVTTSAVLKATGVGDANATAISAAMTWAMRDGVGMIGGLTFSYFAAPRFDANVKVWRLFADFINDAGLFIDMLAPLWGSQLLFVSSLSTICKTMCGISAGSTKGSITLHFSRRGNVADLNAKESTQETLVSLIGMVLGVLLARILHSLEKNGSKGLASMVSWVVFIVLTILHMIFNYECVSLLKLRSLNRERLKCALHAIVDTVASDCLQSAKTDYSVSNQPSIDALLLSPDQVSESLWMSFQTIFYQGDVVLGANLEFVMGGTLSPQELRHYLMDEFCNENYAITVAASGKRDVVAVSLRTGAGEKDEFKAFFHSMVVRKCLDSLNEGKSSFDAMSHQELIRRTHNRVDVLSGETATKNNLLPGNRLSLDALARKGWNVESRLNFGFTNTKIQWHGAKAE